MHMISNQHMWGLSFILNPIINTNLSVHMWKTIQLKILLFLWILYRHLSLQLYNHKQVPFEEEAMNFKESTEIYMGGFGRKKTKEEMLWSFNLKNKRKTRGNAFLNATSIGPQYTAILCKILHSDQLSLLYREQSKCLWLCLQMLSHLSQQWDIILT